MCIGCHAKSAAMNADGHNLSVSRTSNRSSNAVFAACNKMFVRCGPAGLWPKRLVSIMCDSQVSGNQLLACMVVKAHLMPANVRPFCTMRLSVT